MLKDDPAGFDEGLEEELLALREQRDGEEERRLAMDRASEKAGKDQLALRKRVEEVQEKERLRTVTELLYLKVCARFKKLQVPLIPPLKEGGDVKFGGVDLKGLTTDIYSEDALQLVREHLFRIIGQEGSNSVLGDIAIVRLALFQVGQVYALSSLFGYYLRRVDSRYQLEKLAGSLGVWDADAAAPAQEDLEAVQSLKDYINTFGPEEVHQMRSIASVEAQMAMESQVSALFGNLRVLKERLISALDLGAGSDSAEEVERKLEQAIKNNEVESVRITSDNLRRLVLEAVAYGAALNDAEKQVDSLYELTPLAGRPRGSLTGDDEGAGRYLPE